KYFGTFFNDKKHGYGYYVWPNGSNYLGTFYLDKRSGYGIMRYSNDSMYEGFFSNDQRYGPGIFITITSTTYELNIGYWKNDRLIRLKKSALNNQAFHFIKQFPQYNFYKLINLQLILIHHDRYSMLQRTSAWSTISSSTRRTPINRSETVPQLNGHHENGIFSTNNHHSHKNLLRGTPGGVLSNSYSCKYWRNS
ncbi:uncharacterized protein DC041_0004596, partial [Schistosoma bovis]